MVTRVNSSIPAVVTHSRSYVKPIIAVLAIAAIAYLVIPVARSLMGRVQAMTDPQALHKQGQAAAESGYYEEAIQKYSLALQCNPDNELRADILADRAAAYAVINNPYLALVDYRAALGCTADTNFLARIHMNIGEVDAKSHEYESALKEYTEAMGLNPSDEEIKTDLQKKLESSQLLVSRDPEHCYQMGCADIKKAEYAKAIGKFNLALQCNPSDKLRADVLADRADAYFQIKKFDDALRDFRAALTYTADTDARAVIHMLIGTVYLKKNEPSLAAQEYTEALKSEYSNPRIKPSLFLRRACSRLVLDENEKAFEDFTAALECKFEDRDLLADLLSTRAKAYVKINEIVKAINDLELAIACNCENLELKRLVHEERGKIYSSMDKHELAIADYNQALKSKGDDEYVLAQILCGRGFSYLALGRLDEAMADFQTANNCNFTDRNLRASILGSKAMVYIQQQNIGDALTDLTKAIDWKPTLDLDGYLCHRGQVLNHLGRFPEAIEDFNKAMEFHLLPTESRAQILLQRGKAHRENNNPEQAQQDWETALKCKISPELKEAINAELNPKGPTKALTIGSLWGWARSKLTGGSKK